MTSNTYINQDERLDEVNENLKIIQKKNGLTFGTDAYMLAAFMRPEKKALAAEFGSGTGIISLLCAARQRFAHIDAYEIQSEFAQLGQRNIDLNQMQDRITQYQSDIRDIPTDRNGTYDIVFSNPPYMKSGHGERCAHDMKTIARHEEAGGIADFCAAAARLLKYGGKFYCVFRPDRLIDLVASMRAHKLEPKRMTFIQSDALAAPSIVLVEAKLGASS
ncbi:MAG: methyltransferase, partial [Clostridia bacterium]|nr:methyltransferase [Clostridia bacterium]